MKMPFCRQRKNKTFAVTRFHNKEAADNAYEEFKRIFVKKGIPDDMPLHNLDAATDIGVCAFLTSLEMTKSNGEARRLIQGGGVQIKGEKLSDPQLKINLNSGDEFIVKVGKKKFSKIKVN